MEARTATLFLPVLLAGSLAAQAVPAPKLPVRELTAFKDGHAYVRRAAEVPLPADGRIVLDELPRPILGTFWPAVGGAGLTLHGVTAGQRRVEVERTALELRQMLEANVGQKIVVRETGDIRYEATIVELVGRSAGEVAESDRSSAPTLGEKGDSVWLRTETTRRNKDAESIADAGLRLVKLDHIVDVTFLGEPKRRFVDEQIRPQLVLDVQCAGARPATAAVDLVWIERGFRWIPNYRVELDGKGKAVVRLQATLVDDLVDLNDATVHLVVGVPSFVGKDTPDPMSLQAAITAAAGQMAQVLSNRNDRNFYNNAIMTQQVAGNEAVYSEPAPDMGGDLDVGKKEQDLYVFTLVGITLRKHERMVVTLGETTVDYHDVWKLDVPIAPPQEVWDQLGAGSPDLARLLAAPKVRHEVRLKNGGKAPFTTGPALVLQGGQVLAQGTITYTPSGSSVDLALTTAVDLLVKKTDRETGRTPNAVSWNNSNFMRVDLTGKILIANRRAEAVDIEVRRTCFGKLTETSAGGTMEQLSVYDSDPTETLATETWSRHNWFSSVWSQTLNGLGRAQWTVHVEPGKDAEVACSWQYYWR